MPGPFDQFRALTSRLSGRSGRGSDVSTTERIRTDGGFDRVLENPSLVAAALDSLDDVFYVFDTDARLIAWNQRLNDVFDVTDEELEGTPGEEFFIEADRERIRAAIADIFETGETDVEARVKTKGPVVRFQLTGHRLVDDEGRVVGFSGIGRDVTADHEREVRLSLQNERLSEFASVVSHDLRNPLQVASGLLELERSERDSERLDRVAWAVDRMTRIVDDVLTVAREGRDLVDPVSVQLGAVARSTWETVDTADASLAIRTQTSVEGDPDRLDRLFANCFRNAVEHGGADVTVSVVDTERGFAIEDDGAGVPPEDRERIFEPGVSGSSEGTGFGLDIVRGVAEAHGWSVSVAESDAGGARFEFDLGLVDPAADD
ncbi:MAG: sensor histidine kinase [Halosimplex sp.]